MAYTREQFLTLIQPYAIQKQQETGIPASLIMAQAAVESGDGNSDLTKKANALFGYKGQGPAGSVKMRTKEEGPNGTYYTMADFKAYGSWADSLNDYAALLSRPLYAAVRGKDGYTAAVEVQKAGYATNSNYAADLQSVIKQYNLTQYDNVKPGSDVSLVGFNNQSSTNPFQQAGFNLNPLQPILDFDWMRVLWALVGILILAAGIFIAFGAGNPVVQTVSGVVKNATKAAASSKGKSGD